MRYIPSNPIINTYEPELKDYLNNHEKKYDELENSSDDAISKKQLTYDTMYTMCMLDQIYLFGRSIQRVPGGWIFDRDKAAVFVPYVDKQRTK